MTQSGRLIATLIVGSAVTAACGPAASDDQAPDAANVTPASDPTAGVDPPPDPFGVIGLLDSLRAAPVAVDLTLGDPASFTYSNPRSGRRPGDLGAEWCFRSERASSLPDRSVIRTTFHFSPPRASDDLALTSPAQGRELALRHCRLGWVSRQVLASADPAASAAAIRETLVTRYGPGTPTTGPSDVLDRAGMVQVSSRTQWTTDGYTIELAVAEDGFPLVYAHPSVDDRTRPRRPPGFERWESLVAAVVLETAALEPESQSSLEATRAAVADGLSGPDELAGLLNTIRQMTTPVATFADGAEVQERHAARLALVDELLRDGLGPIRVGSPAIDSLRALGADYSCRFGECTYGRNLIDMAIGRSRYPELTARLAESVFRFRPCITFSEVIKSLEYLRGTDPEVGAHRSYLLGTAYATIAGLSQGAGDPFYFPWQEYADLADDARSRGLEHLVAALEGDLDPVARAHAWQTAFKLSAGLGVEATYACSRQQRCEDPTLRTLRPAARRPKAETRYDMSLTGPYSSGIGLLRPERWGDRMIRWEYSARLPLFTAPGGSLLAWISDGWLRPESGEARPLGRNGMIPVSSEPLNWIVEEYRDDGWLRMRYAPGESGLAWTHECMFALGASDLVVERWEDVLTGGLWLLRDTSQPLRVEPADDAAVVLELSGSVGLLRRELRGDWIRVRAEIPDGHCGRQTPEETYEGWIRWRDPEGQLTVRKQWEVC